MDSMLTGVFYHFSAEVNMNINRITAIILFYSTMIILPCLLAAWLIFAHEASWFMLCAKLVVAVLYAALIFIIGYWGFIGYFLRYAVLALSVASAVYAALTGVEAPTQTPNIVLLAGCVVVVILLIYFLAKTLAAFSYQGGPIRLAFPFRGGRYYILEGGDSKKGSLLNYHFAGSSHAKSNVNRSMRYATDIVNSAAAARSPKGYSRIKLINTRSITNRFYAPATVRLWRWWTNWKTKSPSPAGIRTTSATTS